MREEMYSAEYSSYKELEELKKRDKDRADRKKAIEYVPPSDTSGGGYYGGGGDYWLEFRKKINIVPFESLT